MSRSAPATFQAYYNEPYNALVKPTRFLWYFRQKWMRELGPVGTSIVLYLRGLCYHNPDKGELRDICEVRMEEIAEAIGVSRATVARELSDKDNGEPVNPALRRFVMRQQQYNLTEKGVRRATTLYHVSMDDPIHPDDEAQYALLCRQFHERQSAREEGPLKPRILRKSQIETLAPPSDDSKSQIETLATDRKSQFETTYIGDLYSSFTETLNVSARKEASPAPEPQRSTLNEGEKGIHTARDRAVQEVITLTGDEGSRKRFEQLWEIAEGRNALDAWSAALRATKRRMGANNQLALERPGAYFDSICIKELEKREIFVPTNAEKQAESEVGNIIRQGLFLDLPDNEPTKAKPERIPLKSPVPPVPAPLLPEQLDAELVRLEEEGGADLERFEAFVAAERERYGAELGNVRPATRERLLTAFDTPEKRRSLHQTWRNNLPSHS